MVVVVELVAIGAAASAEDKDVRPFQFGSDDLSLLGDYYALRMINERFARMARQVFLPMLRMQAVRSIQSHRLCR